jgi:hypothetical protein
MNNTIPCIISTWNNEDISKIDLLKKSAIDVIVNKIPDYNGIQNVNYANCSIISGLNRAKELGYTHALRFRTDYYCPNIIEFINICEQENTEKLLGLCWYKHYVPPHGPYGYIMDHLMYGPIDKLLSYRGCFQEKNDNRFTEAFLQDTYFKKCPVVYEDVKNDFIFILDKLRRFNIKVYCFRHGNINIINQYKNDFIQEYDINRCII